MSEAHSQQSKSQRRIFFALWPEQATRDALKKTTHTDITHYLKTNQARKVPVHNWHLTLAFVGNVSDETVAGCLQQGSQIVADSFSLTLNRFAYFEQPQVVWLGCDQIPNAWYDLVNRLNEVLAVCGYQPDRNHPLPHMTVLRKAKQPMAVTQFKPVTWKVSEFALIESTTTDKGTHYSVVQHWPLQ